MNQEESENLERPSILEAVSMTQQNAALRSFNAQSLIEEYLEKLAPREKQIIISRYGLADGVPLTLETIGKKMTLTRERVRQIEKESLKKLKSIQPSQGFRNGLDLVFQIIEENGKITSTQKIFDAILAGNDSEVNRQGILFILHLVAPFNHFKETADYHEAWFLPAFEETSFQEVLRLCRAILAAHGRPLPVEELHEKLKNADEGSVEMKSLSSDALESYLSVTKKIGRNPFNEWGLAGWTAVKPKDVGDKAYLVLAHHKKPEHYAKITEMINKNKFDDRMAQKETVHNELIKDKRFVLVGRGIYALAEWGYQPGVVADIISGILKQAKEPLAREEIIKQVLEQRLVKRNTVIVGLSNKTLFKKTSQNKYLLADHV